MVIKLVKNHILLVNYTHRMHTIKIINASYWRPFHYENGCVNSDFLGVHQLWRPIIVQKGVKFADTNAKKIESLNSVYDVNVCVFRYCSPPARSHHLVFNGACPLYRYIYVLGELIKVWGGGKEKVTHNFYTCVNQCANSSDGSSSHLSSRFLFHAVVF
jgi:hypothetical protein